MSVVSTLSNNDRIKYPSRVSIQVHSPPSGRLSYVAVLASSVPLAHSGTSHAASLCMSRAFAAVYVVDRHHARHAACMYPQAIAPCHRAYIVRSAKCVAMR